MVGLKCKASRGFDPFMLKCGNSTADVAALHGLVRRLVLMWCASVHVGEPCRFFTVANHMASSQSDR